MNRKLKAYRAKRDFSKTPEPADSEAAPSAGSDQLRFVVQKHAARRLHYDFRLELAGVFKSWAVTRGPSADPAEKRLAVEVEDHPLPYGDFEGVIPAGQYGGGTVMLWDRGYWRPQGDPVTSIKAGELKFELFGERLKGSWVLVRMRGRPSDRGRSNWLLIKHRDAAATTPAKGKRSSSDVLAAETSIASERTMEQIAAGSGPQPKPFINAATKQAAAKPARKTAARAPSSKTPHRGIKPRTIKRMPAFVAPELCKLVSQPPDGEPWLHEIKLDGYRLQLRVERGKVTLKTRNGLDWTHKFPAVANAARTLKPCIIDGEMVALNTAGTPDFAALQAALAENATEQVVFYAFDLLFLEQHDLRPLPLIERKGQLQVLLNQQDSRLRYVEHLLGDGAAIWQAACRSQLEGIISKRGTAPYTSGRGGDWAKTKCRAGHEVVIGGMSMQDGQLRSLLAGVMRDRHLIYVGRIGTGFSSAVRRQIMPRLKALRSDTNPFHGATAPRHSSDIVWLRPKLVAEIEFAGWTNGGRVRQAAFKGLREDKPALEVQAETPDAGADSPSPSKRVRGKTSAKVTAHSKAVGRLSHPDKLLWPAAQHTQAVTKQDLATYYQEASEWMLPHLHGRPCSIVRAPDGIDGEHFFQRHTPSAGSELGTIKIAGDRKPYLMIDSAAALAAVAQLSAVELHPGNCVPDKPEVPGRLVFDLDPAPEVNFKAVIKAALELRERLNELHLHSFCKTTGGKGLHVVVPLSAPRASSDLNWQSAKLFAQTLCAQMAADSPALYLLNMSKAARRGRIFLDYLRNDRLATAVAPLSPRARAGAPVSMPLNWSQVQAGLDPQRFTLTTALALLRSSRAWQDYARSGASLLSAMKLLLKQQRRAA